MSLWTDALPCLFHVEQYTIFYIVAQLNEPGFIMTDTGFRGACILSGLEYGSVRWEMFVGTYPMEHHAGLPFPPPFDDIWDLNNECWFSLHAYYFDPGIPLDNTDCDILNFKGNQGGTWPTTWP